MKKYIVYVLAALSIFFFASCSGMIRDFNQLQSESTYVVKNYFETAEDETVFKLDSSKNVKTKGKIGTVTAYVPAEVEGFEVKSINQQEIKSDGTTEVEVYYSRKTVTVTFEFNNGKINTYSSIYLTGKYGTTKITDTNYNKSTFLIFNYPDKDPVRNCYTFAGWDVNDLVDFPSEDTTVNALWSQFGSYYRVMHYLSDENGTSEFTVKSTDEEGNEIEEVQKFSLYRFTTLTGAWNTQTDAHALNLKGYEVLDIEQGTISEDNSTVVNIFYVPEDITVSFLSNGGSWKNTSSEVVTVSGKYKSALTSPSSENLSRTYYEFTGWSPEVPASFPSENKAYYAQWNQTEATYKVNHYFETVESTSAARKYSLEKTETLVSALDVKTEAQALTELTGFNLSGFEVQPFEQETVNADFETEVDIFYNRKTINLTFNPNAEENGQWSDGSTSSKVISGMYGTDAVSKMPDEPSNTDSDYAFVGWEGTDGLSGFSAQTFPASDVTYTAMYSKNTADWTVNYKTETETEDIYTVYKTDTHKGKIGNLTNPEVIELAGYTVQDFENVEIKDDDSSVVNILYKRNTVTLSFDPNGGFWNNDDGTTSADAKTVSGRFGTAVTVPSSAALSRNDDDGDYAFTDWSPSAPETFPANDTTYYAQWDMQNAKYAIRTYVENTSGEMVYESYESRKGTLGSWTDVTASDRTGFTSRVTNAEIKSDGSTVAYIYYERITVTYTYNTNTGYWINSDGSTSTDAKTISGKYGTAVTLPDTTTIAKENWSFLYWRDEDDNDVPSVYGTENLSFDAQWKHVSADYSVMHWIEKLTYTGDDDKWEQYGETETKLGTIDAQTLARAKSIPGFTAVTFYQQTVLEDGSTVVNIYYNRNTVTITLDVNYGYWISDKSYSNKLLSGKYEADVPSYGSVKRNDYVFTGWLDPVPLTFPAANTTYTAQWDYRGTSYTVKYLFENLDGTYTENEDYRKIINANAGETTQATALSGDFEGFTVEQIEQQTVSAANSVIMNEGLSDEYILGETVVEVKYSRNNVTLTFDAAGGTWSDDTMDAKTVSGKYGTSVTKPFTQNPSRTYWEFTGWSPSVIPSTFPASSINYTAQWEQTSAPYTVKYYYESLDSEDDVYVEYAAQRQTLEGELGAVTSVTASPLTGFTPLTITQKTILADGSTVVEVKYRRNRYTLTFDPNEGEWTDGTTSVKTVTGKYETEVSFSERPVKDEYGFTGWSRKASGGSVEAIPVSFAESITYYAQWEQTDADYTVNHWLQNADGAGYTLTASAVFAGKIGEQTAASSKTVSGFTAQSFTQETIAASDTVVNIYYNRNTITLTLDPNGGTLSGSATVSGLYGSDVPAVTDPVREDYEFTGWLPVLPATFPVTEGTYSAQWNQTTAKYIIKTYYEQLDGTMLLASTDGTNKGTVGETTNVTASEVDGYNLQTITQQVILADGSTVVEVNYKRKTITYTFNGNGGTWSVSNTASGLYGETVSIPDTTYLTRTGYFFYGWDAAVPVTFGTEDKTFKAVWKSGVTGVGKNTAANDIVLTLVSNTGGVVSLAVDVPFDATWSYLWIVDGSDSGVTNQTFTKTLSTGTHNITVDVSANGLNYTKSLSVTVE